MPDALTLAVEGAAYWLSERDAVDTFVVGWVAARHPCDDEPYVILHVESA